MTSQTKNTRDSIFLILCVMGLFAILSSTMSKNPVLNPFATSLGTPEPWMGFVAAASTIPGIIISLPAGSLSDIFGRRRVLLVSSMVFASAPFLYFLITSWWQLILVRFYHGFATALFIPVANASIAELFPTKRGERISAFSSMTIIGRGVAPILGGYILSITNDSFPSVYLVVGVAGATALITALPLLSKGRPTVRSENLKETRLSIIHTWRKVAKTPKFLVVSFVEASQYYTFGAVEYFLVGYLKDIVQLDSFLIGIISGAPLVTVMISKPFVGRFSDKIGRRIPIAFGAVISGIPLLAIPFTTHFPLLLLISIVYGLGFSMVTSSTPALASELVPMRFAGTAMGFLSTIMDVGQTLGPIISGFILATGLMYVGLFSSLTLVLLFSCIMFVLFGVAKEV